MSRLDDRNNEAKNAFRKANNNSSEKGKGQSVERNNSEQIAKKAPAREGMAPPMGAKNMGARIAHQKAMSKDNEAAKKNFRENKVPSKQPSQQKLNTNFNDKSKGKGL